jgi:hypothetical protein
MAKKMKITFLITDADTKEVLTAEEFGALKGITRLRALLSNIYAESGQKVVRLNSNDPILTTPRPKKERKPNSKPKLTPRLLYVTPAGVAFTRKAPDGWTHCIDTAAKTYRTPADAAAKTIDWEAGVFRGTRKRKEPQPEVLL